MVFCFYAYSFMDFQLLPYNNYTPTPKKALAKVTLLLKKNPQ